MHPLVTSLRAVRDAIECFEAELQRSPPLAGRLAYARAWYACRDAQGRWHFGPSKFVGYENLTAQRYVTLSRNGLDGRRTESQLRKWFTLIDPSTELYEQLSSQLSAMLATHGKAPSRKMRISIPREDYDELHGEGPASTSPPVIDLMVAVAKSLPNSELMLLRKRLMAIGT